MQLPRAGVIFPEIVSSVATQLDLFAQKPKKPIMSVIDRINRKNGKNTIFFGAQGIHSKWKPVSNWRSPKYTTDWSELLRVVI